MPSTPPSLVKLAARAAAVRTGASSSRPTRPQVPREMYAASSPASGTPTTRTPCRGTPPRPGTGRATPTRLADAAAAASPTDRRPGRPDRRTAPRGRPSVAIRSSSQLPVAHVEQPGRRGVGALGDLAPGEPVARAGRAPAAARSASPDPGVGGQLVDGVEGQELQAVAAWRSPGGTRSCTAIGPRGAAPLVAVVERRARAAGRRGAGRSRRPSESIADAGQALGRGGDSGAEPGERLA